MVIDEFKRLGVKAKKYANQEPLGNNDYTPIERNRIELAFKNGYINAMIETDPENYCDGWVEFGCEAIGAFHCPCPNWKLPESKKK